MNSIPEGVQQAAMLLQQQREISLLHGKLAEIKGLCIQDPLIYSSRILDIIDREDV